MWKPKTLDEWLAEHAPQHEALEAWKKLEAKIPPAEAFAVVFSGTAEPRPRPDTLIDMYLQGDARQIWQDALLRPEHYDARQHELLASLMGHGQLDSPATLNEKNELFLTWQRTTDQDRSLRQKNTAISSARHDGGGDIILEDGRTLEESEQDAKHRSTFEAQDFDDKILI